MKNIIKTTVLSMVLFSFAISCNDEFLERYPLDSISDASYWKSATDLKMFCNTWYSNDGLLPMWRTYNLGPFMADAASDTQASIGYNTYLNGEKTIAASGDGWGTGDWGLLRQFNYFMENYEKVEKLTSFDAVKQYVGECLFFRSLFYFQKLQRYGDVPWTTAVVTVDADILKGPRTPRNQVVTNLMKDLDDAANYLKAQAGGAWTGRVTKETAMALQARIALYEGTWEKYHAGTPYAAATNESQKFLQKAAEVAGALISTSESTGYPALDGVGKEYGYRDLFNQYDYATNKEVIFWRKYQPGVFTTGHWHSYSHEGGQVGATKSLIDSYLKLDGTPVEADYDDSNLVKVAEGRDPRLAQTININDGKHWRFEKANPPTYFIAPAFDIHQELQCPTGYQIYKGHDFRLPYAAERGQGQNALIYFRYGEILLIFAEAKAELGTITQGDLDRSINKLRARVGMANLTLAGLTSDPNFEFSKLSPIIQAVRRERKVELAVEGFRFADIMRWRAAGELIVGKIPVGAKLAQWQGFKFSDCEYDKTQNGRQEGFDLAVAALMADDKGYIKPFKNQLNGGTQGFKFNESKNYLYPIPTDEFNLNPSLTQNPGW